MAHVWCLRMCANVMVVGDMQRMCICAYTIISSVWQYVLCTVHVVLYNLRLCAIELHSGQRCRHSHMFTLLLPSLPLSLSLSVYLHSELCHCLSCDDEASLISRYVSCNFRIIISAIDSAILFKSVIRIALNQYLCCIVAHTESLHIKGDASEFKFIIG